MSDRKVVMVVGICGGAALIGTAIWWLSRKKVADVSASEDTKAKHASPESAGLSASAPVNKAPGSSLAEAEAPVVEAAQGSTEEKEESKKIPVEQMTTEARTAEAQKAKSRGNKRFQGKQFDLAIQCYTEAIELSPDPKDAQVSVFYCNRAACHSSLEQYKEAVLDCDRALAIDPQYVKALNRRALAQEKMQNFDEALLDYTAACLLSGFQNDVATNAADRLLKEMGNQQAAARLKEPVFQLPSTYFITTFIQSFAYHRTMLSQVDKQAPLGEIAQDIANATAKTGLGSLLIRRAMIHMAKESYDAALTDWENAAKTGGFTSPSEEAQVHNMCGMFYHLRGSFDLAAASYNKALELDPTNVNVLVKRASLWYEQEKPTEAFDDFESALKHAPDDPDVYCHRGQVFMLRGEFATAVADLRKCIALDTSSVLACIQLAMALYKDGKATEAFGTFENAEAEFKDAPEVYNYHGELLIEQGNMQEALAKFEKAIQVGGHKCAVAYVNKGMMHLQMDGNINKALEFCNKAVEVDSLCEAAYVHLAHLALQQNDLKGAVHNYDKAISLLRMQQELAEAHAMRAAAAAQLQLLEKQPEIYKPAMEKNRAAIATAK